MNERLDILGPSGPPRREIVQVGTILVIALLLRLAALAAFPNLIATDTAKYIQAGQELFEHGQISIDNVMPLYPAWTYITGGGLGLKLADITLSVLTVGLLYCLTLEVFRSTNAAKLAAAIAAAYPFFLYYSVLRLSETAFIFLTCSAFLALYR